jgi:hypothetical protein
MMEEPFSSETYVLTTGTRRNVSEDGILHSHRHKNLKSYKTQVVLNIKEREPSILAGLHS